MSENLTKEVIEAKIESGKTSIWSFFVNHWRVAILTLFAILIGGIIGVVSLPQESDPEVKIPIGVVTTAYRGASPNDMEKLITEKIETRLKNLDNLKNLTSTSSEGISSIVVEFDASADLDESIRDLRDEVEFVKPDLPEGAEDPIVTEVRASDQPIITFSLLGNLPPQDLKELSKELEEILEGIPGVSKVGTFGVQEEQMQIFLEKEKMDGYGLSVSQIISKIQSSHLDFPVGTLLTDNLYYQVSLKGQFTQEEELLNLPIGVSGGQNILLKDIGTVREFFAEDRTISQVYVSSEKEYKKAVTLQLYKKTGANIIDVVEEAKEKIEQFKKDVLPPSSSILITNDFSEFIREDIDLLFSNGWQTIILIFVLLFVSLGVREALLAGISVPFMFLASFLGLYLVGETLNFLTLFGLILALGLIVDNSIVIMEDIYDNMKNKKLSPYKASILTIQIYKGPLIASTLTTIAAFLPMMLMSGIMGEYVKHIPITINITLIGSLIVPLLLLPAISKQLFSWGKSVEKEKEPFLTRKFFQPVGSWYERKMRNILSSKWKRRGWVIGMIIALFVTLSFPFVGILKVQMFPGADNNFFNVAIKLPAGSAIEKTQETTKKVEAFIETLPYVENFVTVMGGASIVSFDAPGGGNIANSNVANITINLFKKDDRDKTSQEITAELRSKVASITEAEIEVKELESGPPTGAPIEVRVLGKDMGKLEQYAVVIQNELRQIPGTYDVKTDIEHGTGEYHLIPQRDRLELYGISTLQLASELRNSVFGNDMTKIVRDGEETPIVVRTDFRAVDCLNDTSIRIEELQERKMICKSYPQDIATLQNMLISTPKGKIPLSELVEINLHPVINAIHHRDTETVVNIRSFHEASTTPTEVVSSLQKKLAEKSPPEGIKIAYGGETEDTTESFKSLANSMIVGILLIVLILVLEFNSFKQPLIIMFTIPLSLIGVLAGLSLLGRYFSFPGFIGIVALCGIVVNNAIVLIDRININIRENKLSKFEALIVSGKERLQPITMTTLSTVIGGLPLAFTSAIWEDLAWTIVIGITFGTILTLVMVPIFYMALVKDKEIEEMIRGME